MKIFIAHSWTDVGINIQTKTVANELSKHFEIIFLTQARVGKPVLRISDRLIIVEWPHKRPNRLSDFRFICRTILSKKPDVFIVHFGATNISMIAAWALRVKYRICWMHTLSEQYFQDSKHVFSGKFAFLFRRLAYRLATHVIVMNEFARNDALLKFNIPPENIHKIYNGILPFKPDGLRGTYSTKIRFSGRLDHSKGVDVLIIAIAILRIENCQLELEIAGKGNAEEELKSLAIKLGIEQYVHFCGYFSDYEMARGFIAEAYCLIVPSRIDNFPTVILEAFSSGVPVIASKVGGISDMIEDGKDGLLVEPDDPKALAFAIKRVIKDEPFRNELAIHGLNSYIQKFSMERHVTSVFDFLNNLDQSFDKK